MVTWNVQTQDLCIKWLFRLNNHVLLASWSADISRLNSFF